MPKRKFHPWSRVNGTLEERTVDFLDGGGSIVRRERWYRENGRKWLARWQDKGMPESRITKGQKIRTLENAEA